MSENATNSTNPTNSINSTNPTNSTNPPLVEVFTTFLQAATRPVITVIFAGVIAQVVIEGITPPQWFLALATGAITWWFADRTVQHIKDTK
jgi:hypothetical protein